jgi:hypothetical protein
MLSGGLELSVTVSITLEVPAAVGFPVIAPAPLELVTCAQPGKPAAFQVYGGVPPLAFNG